MRFRIVAAMVALLAGSAAVSIAVVRQILLDRLEEEIRVDLRNEAEEFGLLAGGLDPRTGEPFTTLHSVFDLYFEREVPDEGETLLAFVGLEIYDSAQAAQAVAASRLGDALERWSTLTQREEGDVRTEDGTVRYVALPLELGGESGTFVVANFPEFERREINDALRTQALTQFATILAASLVGLALARRVLRPLRSLAATAEAITATDLTRRIPVRGDDEASRIARAFNDMLERLEQAFAAQRTFLDDAGHELRVPLTVVRGYVELLELETDPDEREASITVITDEIERMNRIVEDLLVLAKSGRPDFLILGEVDVGELTREVYRKASVLGTHEWELSEVAEVTTHADAQRLTQAMMQLAANATQHTPHGTLVRVGSRVSGDTVVLWVHDSGPGVRPEDATRIFGRLVKDPGRSGSSGLGLSIVAAIAEAHGGSARVSPGVVSGARFEIRIPVGATPSYRDAAAVSTTVPS